MRNLQQSIEYHIRFTNIVQGWTHWSRFCVSSELLIFHLLKSIWIEQTNYDDKPLQLNACKNNSRIEIDYSQSTINSFFDAKAPCRKNGKSFHFVFSFIWLTSDVMWRKNNYFQFPVHWYSISTYAVRIFIHWLHLFKILTHSTFFLYLLSDSMVCHNGHSTFFNVNVIVDKNGYPNMCAVPRLRNRKCRVAACLQ